MKAGIFSIGLDTYWPQFDGLLDNLNGYHAEIRDRIAGMGTELVDGGMVDNVEKAHEVSALFKKEDVEVIFLFPWAVVYRELGLFGIIEMAVFVFILLVGFVYALKKGAFEWE